MDYWGAWGGGAKGMSAPSQIIGGLAPLSPRPLFLRLCQLALRLGPLPQIAGVTSMAYDQTANTVAQMLLIAICFCRNGQVKFSELNEQN